MKHSNDLKKLLLQIDKKSYPAYKSTKGVYQFGSYALSIDHVQGDPFASPSKVSIIVEGAKAGFPVSLYDLPFKRIALSDHLTRLFHRQLRSSDVQTKGSGKSGLLSISRCGQEILERTACEIAASSGTVTVRFEVGFPARGRTIDAAELIHILFDFLPACVDQTLFYHRLDQKKIERLIQLAEDQQYIRQQLPLLGLSAFVADGAVLPRESGVSPKPMKHAIPFQSPESMTVSLNLPHRGKITGMGIKKGIFLIVGGGYHGKSTLLKALETGVYNHIEGDGREYVITDGTAVKIRSEDGRSIKKTDISMFINNLPNKKDTVSFYSDDASGSTSQAANVIEALESGSRLLLIDEDTCATNFMIRDELMQRVIHQDQEPITPFIERIRPLYEQLEVSSILVAGSCGAYFHVADQIIQMDQYCPKDITEMAKKEAAAFPISPKQATAFQSPDFDRVPVPNQELKNNSRVKVKTLSKDAFSINHETIDLRCIEQIVDTEQTTALAYLLLYCENQLFDRNNSIQTIVSNIRKKLVTNGLPAIVDRGAIPVHMAMPRDQEIYAAINRCRSLKLL